MSREDLNSFFRAANHNYKLRESLLKCKNTDGILELAKNYGFSITLEDLNQDEISDKARDWFEVSRIYPIKKRGK